MYCLRILSLLLVFTLMMTCTSAPANDKSIVAAPPGDTISFSLSSYNNMLIPAKLNGQDSVTLMLHTAASDVSLIRTTTANFPNMLFEDMGEGNAWGGQGNTRYSPTNTLDMGMLHWDSLGIWESERTGHFADGKIGLSLLQHPVVELDFEEEHLILYDSIPAKAGQFERISISYDGDFLFLPAQCQVGDSLLSHRFLLHSGYSGAVLFDDKFAAQHALTTQLSINDQSVLHDSYGNELITQKATLPQFKLAQTTHDSLPVSFFSGSIARQSMSIVGADVLKRYDVIMDLEGEALYLRPNALMDMDYGS